MVEVGKITAIIDGDISQLSSALNKAKGEATTAVAGIEQQVGKQMGTGITGGLKSSLSEVGPALASMVSPAGLAIAGVGAIGAGLVGTVNVAANFESAMSRVGATSGANAEELKRMSDAAREAGSSTVFSASQAADAMYFLASSGMSVDEQIAALPETLSLASAGGLDLARAAEITTSTIAQFGLSAEDTGRISNVFAAGAAKSNTDVTQLGNAMNYVGPVAASLGYSIEETTAALGIFANAGLKGEQGGTVMRGALSALLSPSKEAGAALAEMGLTIKDIDPSANSFSEILQKLGDNGMTAGQAVQIFGREAGPGMLAAVSQGSDALVKLEKDITGTNAAATMSAQMTGNMKGAWAEFSSAAEEAGISLGNVLLPVLTDTIKLATGGIGAITEFGKELSGWTTAATGSGGSLDALGGWIVGTFGGVSESDLKPALAEATSDAVATGTKEGMEEGAKDAKEGITESVGMSIEEAFTKANDDYAASHPGGMSLIGGKIIGGNDTSAGDIISTVGSTTISGHKFDLTSGTRPSYAYHLELPNGEFVSYDSTENMKAKLPKDMAAAIGRELTDMEVAQIEGDIMTEIKLDNTVKTVWGAYDTKSLGDLIFDPEKLKGVVEDIDRFFDGTMIPEIEKKAEDAKAAWASGQVTQGDIYQSFIQPMEALSEYTPTWLENLNAQFKAGSIDIDTYNDRLDAMIGKNEKVKDSANETQEAIRGMFYGMTGESDKWQDYVNSEGGYIGPTKYYGGYAEDKMAAMQEAAAINEKYGVAGVGSISQIKVDADMSPAEEKKTAFETAIAEANPQMALQVDMARADEQLNAFLTKVITSDPWMTVHVQFIPDVNQLTEMAMAAVDDAIVAKYNR